MDFPTSSSQAETNRRILENIQLKKKLVQTQVPALNQMSTAPLLPGQQSEYPHPNPSVVGTVPRQGFVPSFNNSLGYFIQQDSFMGNSFLLPHKKRVRMACLKLKKLEEYLQTIDGFTKPKINFEQYATPSHIASCMLYNIQSQYGDLEEKTVCDLGSGCGMLSIGASLLGAEFVIGFEIDTDAIEIFSGNLNEMEIQNVDIVQADVLELKYSEWRGSFDTVVLNPPFGTKKNSGMDTIFLECAVSLSTNAVYSLHKSSTRDYIQKKSKAWCTPAEVVAQLRYNLESSYKFHKKKSVDIDVDLWRFDTKHKNF